MFVGAAVGHDGARVADAGEVLSGRLEVVGVHRVPGDDRFHVLARHRRGDVGPDVRGGDDVRGAGGVVAIACRRARGNRSASQRKGGCEGNGTEMKTISHKEELSINGNSFQSARG